MQMLNSLQVKTAPKFSIKFLTKIQLQNFVKIPIKKPWNLKYSGFSLLKRWYKCQCIQIIGVHCAQCTPCKASVFVTFLVTLWDWTYDFGAVGHPLYRCNVLCKAASSRFNPRGWPKRSYIQLLGKECIVHREPLWFVCIGKSFF